MGVKNTVMSIVRKTYRMGWRGAHYLGLNALLRHWRRGVPVAVMYHGVVKARRSWWARHMEEEEFDRHLRFLKERFTIVPVREWTAEYAKGSAGKHRLLTITFDDGYANNFLNAVPVLESHGLTACFFISTDAMATGNWMTHDYRDIGVMFGRPVHTTLDIEGQPVELDTCTAAKRAQTLVVVRRAMGKMPWEEYERLSKLLYDRVGPVTIPEKSLEIFTALTPKQVAEMVRRGMEIGSHSHRHLPLTQYSDEEVAADLRMASEHIREWTGLGVHDLAFAYPRGLYDQRVAEIVRHVGHYCAFAACGSICSGRGLFELPRVGLGGSIGIAALAAATSGLRQWVVGIAKKLRIRE